MGSRPVEVVQVELSEKIVYDINIFVKLVHISDKMRKCASFPKQG